jgi:hypothetical protein
LPHPACVLAHRLGQRCGELQLRGGHDRGQSEIRRWAWQLGEDQSPGLVDGSPVSSGLTIAAFPADLASLMFSMRRFRR